MIDSNSSGNHFSLSQAQRAITMHKEISRKIK